MSLTATEPTPKKPYAPPRLVAYGSVTKLTQGGAGSGTDGGGGQHDHEVPVAFIEAWGALTRPGGPLSVPHR